MKYIFIGIAFSLLLSISSNAQVDSLKYWKKRAKANEAMADKASEMARKARLEADRQHYLFIANEISVRSQELNDKELAALLAVQAYNYNSRYLGYEYNNNVYGGLTAALKRYDSLPLKLYNNPQSPATLRISPKIDSVRIRKDLIVADEKGDVLIVHNGIVRKQLSGHNTRVEHIEISPSRKLMITVSKDMTLCIWNLADLTKHPLVIKEDTSILGVGFSSDETQITVLVNNLEIPIHFWPLTMDVMAKRLCSCLEKNMTVEEWEQYIGHDKDAGAPYEATCPNFQHRK